MKAVEDLDFSKLTGVYHKAAKCGVSFSLNYCESDYTWYFSIGSPAESERWIGKNTYFDLAVERVCEHLDSLHD